MMDSDADDDEQLARKLQEEYDREVAVQLLHDDQEQGEENDKDVANRHSEFGFGGWGQKGTSGKTSHPMRTSSTSTSSGFLTSDISPVDPSLENSDPNPDIRVLFLQFNTQFFWGKLSGIEVKWSPRMTLCAGLCVYEGRGGLCSVRLSLPLLKLRPRKDLVETLLHEMIHAYLFVTDNDRDHDGHGPQFQGHMHRINKTTGANISIHHTFHDEVASYQQHWWRCDGPCQNRRPYFGYVKRAMNRAPSYRDFWWAEHQATCGGTYTKIKEPEGYAQKKGGKKEQVDKTKSQDIRAFKGKGHQLGSSLSKASHVKPNTNSSNVGSSSNPATIFNSVIGSQSNRLNGGSTSAPSTSASTSTSSVIVNGILQRKTESKISSLISKMKSDKAYSAMDNKAAISVGGNSQPNENGKLSNSQQDSVAKRRYGCQDDDDDDLWITDINNIESRPLSSFMRGKAVKRDSDSDSVRKNLDSVNSNKSSKGKASDGWKLGINVFKSRRSSSAYKHGRTKPSVCKGSVFYKENSIQRRKKYVLDDLDSNDNLWDLPHPALEVKREIKAESNVSPLKAKLKAECQIKDEEQNNKGLPQTDTSGIKTEKSPLLSNESEERVDLILKSLKQNRIKREGEKGQRDVTRGSQRNKMFNQDIVDLSDYDDEFDFVSLGKKSSQNKPSSSHSQKSISSFFASSGSKKSSNRKSIFSNVKGHVCGLDTSFCSKCKNDKGVNEELPDIIDLDDDEFQTPSPKKSSSEKPPLRGLLDIKGNQNGDFSRLSSKKNIFASNTSILPKSQKSSTHEKNLFSNASQCSSTPSGSMAKTWLGSNKHKNGTIQKECVAIDDLSDSSEDEFMDSHKVKNKKRSSRDAFSSDESDFSDNFNVRNNKDSHHSSNGLSFNKHKRSGTREDSSCGGSSTGSMQELVDKHKKGKKRSLHDAFASDESDCLDDDYNVSNNKDTHSSSNGLSFKMPKRSGDGEDSSCSGSRNGSTQEPRDEAAEANGNVSCPVCGVFVSTADINVHLDACLTVLV